MCVLPHTYYTQTTIIRHCEASIPIHLSQHITKNTKIMTFKTCLSFTAGDAGRMLQNKGRMIAMHMLESGSPDYLQRKLKGRIRLDEPKQCREEGTEVED